MSSPRLVRPTMAGVAVLLLALWAAPVPAGAATAIDLGTAGSFAVLAGSGITNTGATTISGDVGSFPTPSMTGFGTVVLAGANHGGDAVTQQAKQALTAAYDQAYASAPATSVATELGGRTLTPGTYHGGTLGITGALTLDTQGDPDAVFVFQSDSTLVTASASRVVVLGGATACNVYWQVGSSATFGADSTLVGSVLAATSISAGDGATFQGRLLAQVGAVTLEHNTITAGTCAAGVLPSAAGTVATPTDAAATVPTAGDPSAAAVPEAAQPPAAPAPGSATGTSGPPAAAPPASVARPGAGSTADVGRPGLATTGATDALPLVGSVTVALGLLLVRGAQPRPALAHGVRRFGQSRDERRAYRSASARATSASRESSARSSA